MAAMLLLGLLLLAGCCRASSWQENVRPIMYVQLGKKNTNFLFIFVDFFNWKKKGIAPRGHTANGIITLSSERAAAAAFVYLYIFFSYPSAPLHSATGRVKAEMYSAVYFFFFQLWIRSIKKKRKGRKERKKKVTNPEEVVDDEGFKTVCVCVCWTLPKTGCRVLSCLPDGQHVLKLKTQTRRRRRKEEKVTLLFLVLSKNNDDPPPVLVFFFFPFFLLFGDTWINRH